MRNLSIGGVIGRFLASLILVVATFNPTGYSFVGWIAGHFPHLEPLQLVVVGHNNTAVTESGEAPQVLVNEAPTFGIPRNSSIAIVQADSWSAALSMPPEFRSAATRAAFCTEIKA